MLFSQKEGLEDQLIRLLLKGPSDIKSLHAQLQGVSLRGIYKAVTSLIAEGVLLKVGKRVLIDEEWLRAVREQLSSTLPPLAPEERAAYTFTSIEHLDAFWKTIALQLEEYEQDGQIFFYDPHNFWAYVPARKKSEDEYYAHFAKVKKHAFFTIGGTTKADLEFKQVYQNEYVQVDTKAHASLGRRNHITILGDVITTARLSTPFAARLDTLYDSQRPIAELLPDILAAYEESRSVRLIIERNRAKATRLKKTLSANFYIPR
jgi:hypothetical protein